MNEKFISALHGSVHTHSIRVGILASVMAVFADKAYFSQYGLGLDELKTALLNGGGRHDIGKALLPKELMNKPLDFFSLDDIHASFYKQHPKSSGRLITDSRKDFESGAHFRIALEMALYHHERFDGTGFPYGLSGDEIPFAAQLCAAADRLDNAINFAKTAKNNRISFGRAMIWTLGDKGLIGKDAFVCLKKAEDEIKELYQSRHERQMNEK